MHFIYVYHSICKSILRSLTIFLFLLNSFGIQNLYSEESENWENLAYEHLDPLLAGPDVEQVQRKAKKLKYKWNLAACVIFRDEAPYLKEWIEFHKLVGFKHFYVFNNLSKDNYLQVLSPYIKSGEVELIEWPYESNNVQEWDGIQCAAYNRALLLAKGKAKWLAILDSDEFLFSPSHKDLGDLFATYDDKKIGGVCVNWIMFGTSNVEKVPANKLMIESLILSAGSVHDHFKSIVRPERVKSCVSPHYCVYNDGIYHVTPDCLPVQRPTIFSIDKLRINHYWARDKHFFYTQKLPRRQKWLPLDVAGYEQWNNSMNQVLDLSIFHLVPELRKRMNLP